MKADYCAYPPGIADDVETTEDRDDHKPDRPAYIVGSATTGRCLLLGATEHNVLELLRQSLAPGEVCDQFRRCYGAALSLSTLQNFLAKLDDAGILAGQRSGKRQRPEAWRQLSGGAYFRIKLFNPERLFAWMVSRLRWVWTKSFLVLTAALMVVALGFALLNLTELKTYSGQVLREQFVAILIAGLLVGISHEFAHGLTCRAFGGRATEVGMLMIYYFLPALYCNVSSIHLIRQRSQRLWVIAAGIYWQLLVGTASLLLWLVFAPDTLVANVALIFFLGSVLDLFLNANPLIKLDGYYFLSQWLRLPNLMDRSRAYWRRLWDRIIFGEQTQTGHQNSRRECVIYAVFGLLSTLYIVLLLVAIVWYVGGYLLDTFYLLGLVFTAGLALWYVRPPLRQLLSAGASLGKRVFETLWKAMDRDEAPDVVPTEARWFKGLLPCFNLSPFLKRRHVLPATFFVSLIGILLLPWSASVGNYGTLGVIPSEETIIRAPESATLIELRVDSGDFLASGAVVGRLRNVELEDQIAEAQSDLARARTEHNRVQGELRTHEEAAGRAEVQWRQRLYEFGEITAEQRQIHSREQAQIQSNGTGAGNPATSTIVSELNIEAKYPAAVAVLEAEVALREAHLADATNQLGRARQLSTGAILPRHELETAETRSATLNIELRAARQRLEAALIDHRRKHASAQTDMLLAQSDLNAERAQLEKLEGVLEAMRTLIETLEQRLALLQRRQNRFELVTPRSGVVFGEELIRQIGQNFLKGAEICRVAETQQLLVRIQVPESEIGDVNVGDPVRLKARAYPDQLFRGVVSKIGAESERDDHRRTIYRVELTIENPAGLLRPGMTAFARIDFDRQLIGRILLHKFKQALRPELWML